MRVICVNSQNKPAKIPLSEWITEGEIYTVLEVIKMGLQPGKFGFRLKEVSLSQKSFPYEFYDANRFALLEDQNENVAVLKEELAI